MKSLKFLFLVLTAVAFMAACQKATEQEADTADADSMAMDEPVVEAVAGTGNVWEQDVQIEAAVVEEEGTPAEAPAEATTYSINPEETLIGWKGSKIAYYHNGTINVQSGTLSVNGEGNIISGDFVIDMTSLKNLDLQEKPEDLAKLEGHLKSDDFFDTENYPTANFVITDVEQIDGTKHMVSGNLTMKGVTNKITFPADVEVSDNGVTANALFSIDRTKWNVNYNSGNVFTDLVADKVISDNMAINLDLVATEPAM